MGTSDEQCIAALLSLGCGIDFGSFPSDQSPLQKSVTISTYPHGMVHKGSKAIYEPGVLYARDFEVEVVCSSAQLNAVKAAMSDITTGTPYGYIKDSTTNTIYPSDDKEITYSTTGTTILTATVISASETQTTDLKVASPLKGDVGIFSASDFKANRFKYPYFGLTPSANAATASVQVYPYVRSTATISAGQTFTLDPDYYWAISNTALTQDTQVLEPADLLPYLNFLIYYYNYTYVSNFVKSPTTANSVEVYNYHTSNDAAKRPQYQFVPLETVDSNYNTPFYIGCKGFDEFPLEPTADKYTLVFTVEARWTI